MPTLGKSRYVWFRPQLWVDFACREIDMASIPQRPKPLKRRSFVSPAWPETDSVPIVISSFHKQSLGILL